MLLKRGHRIEPCDNWAILEVAGIDSDFVDFHIGPSLSDELWETITEHIRVSVNHTELQRLIDAHLLSFDDRDVPWDDPDATGEPQRYPQLRFAVHTISFPKGIELGGYAKRMLSELEK